MVKPYKIAVNTTEDSFKSIFIHIYLANMYMFDRRGFTVTCLAGTRSIAEMQHPKSRELDAVQMLRSSLAFGKPTYSISYRKLDVD